MTILRKTILNHILRGGFGCYGQTQYLYRVVHQTIVHAFNRYLFLTKHVLHVSSNLYIQQAVTAAVTFVIPFSELASPLEFHVAHITTGNLYIYISDGSHVIHRIINVVNVVRHYLVMESLKEYPGLLRVLILSCISHHT